jgi:hypothetical protein
MYGRDPNSHEPEASVSMLRIVVSITRSVGRVMRVIV